MAAFPSQQSLRDLRQAFHEALLGQLVCRRNGGVPNMADGDSNASVAFANGVLTKINLPIGQTEHSGQRLGARFAELVKDFLGRSFQGLAALRPGKWQFSTALGAEGISGFAQYAHLAKLQKLVDSDPQIRASLGGDYIVTPDIVVWREALPDEEIDIAGSFLSIADAPLVGRLSPIRLVNAVTPPRLLLASISMKWSIRSDRSQNTRTEALNLIRNRKGHLPHIVAVTFEPLPSRIASLAMGTGDIDCVYHVALHELRASSKDIVGCGEQVEQLEALVEGNRLRDISDLPLDLAI